MFISVIIGSKGRPEVLHGSLISVLKQSRPADEILVVVTGEQDLLPATRRLEKLRIIYSPPGLTRQRNVGLDALSPRSELTVFLDDDVELAADYLTRIENYMGLCPDVVGCSGNPVLNRAENGLLPREKAIAVLKDEVRSSFVDHDHHGLYGCNMVVRSQPAQTERFDEKLGGYAFGEDGDFGIRMQKHGRVTQYSGGRLVHFGTPSGRISQVKHGFVQIMNPSYLFLVKRTYNLRDFFIGPVVAFAANVLGVLGLSKSFKTKDPTYYNRNHRLKGNLLALGYILRGKIDPALADHITEE